jgi:acid phosphatase
LVVLGGCASNPPKGLETLDAALWMQTSVEYRAVALETYRAAEGALVEALRDTSVSAVLEQPSGSGSLPPAVILDVDETVLDNSAYAARRILAGATYSTESWSAWVEEARAPAVPGAVGFVREARRLGVAVFYVTNRNASLEGATRRNLVAAGLAAPTSGVDDLLMLDERPDWGGDKTSRRSYVARTHRVLLLFGDNFEDFTREARASPEARAVAYERHEGRWGRTWFALPNPTYGSWEEALYGFERQLPISERRKRKKAELKPEP